MQNAALPNARLKLTACLFTMSVSPAPLVEESVKCLSRSRLICSRILRRVHRYPCHGGCADLPVLLQPWRSPAPAPMTLRGLTFLAGAGRRSNRGSPRYEDGQRCSAPAHKSSDGADARDGCVTVSGSVFIVFRPVPAEGPSANSLSSCATRLAGGVVD